jgi:hypothetical protein
MPDMILLWMYLAGYAWFWRYHVGYMLDTFGYRDQDGFDITMSMMLGTILCFFWPMSTAGRGVYVLWVRYVSDSIEKFDSIFPPPKQIETRYEKQQRKEREERDLIRMQRLEINRKERELGMKLTVW